MTHETKARLFSGVAGFGLAALLCSLAFQHQLAHMKEAHGAAWTDNPARWCARVDAEPEKAGAVAGTLVINRVGNLSWAQDGDATKCDLQLSIGEPH